MGNDNVVLLACPGRSATVVRCGPGTAIKSERGTVPDHRRPNVRFGSWLRKNVSERSKAASDWLASTLKRADWLFLRSRGLETFLKLPEVILSDLETPRQ